MHPVGTGSGASLSDATPDALTPDQTGSAGTATAASRADHAHAIAASTPVSVGTSNQEGNFTSFARTNHVHAAITTATPAALAAGGSAVLGTSTTRAARQDHVHATASAAPVTVGTANAEGTATTFSRSDHVHEGDGAGNGGGGTGSGNPNATRIVTGVAWDSGAGGNESVTATGWRNCDMLMPVFEDSGELAPLTSNSSKPFHAVDLFFASALDTDGSMYVGVSQNEGVRILEVSQTTDELSFQWVGGSPAPSQGDMMDLWCLDAGGSHRGARRRIRRFDYRGAPVRSTRPRLPCRPGRGAM